MRENELREKMASFPITAQWKSALLMGTHSMLTMPSFASFSGRNNSHDPAYVELRWHSFYDNPTDYFSAKLYEDGVIGVYSTVSGTSMLIPPFDGTSAYQWKELLNVMEEEVMLYRDMLGM